MLLLLFSLCQWEKEQNVTLCLRKNRGLFQKAGFQNSEFETKLRVVRVWEAQAFSFSEHVLRVGFMNSESELPRVTLVHGNTQIM